MYSQGSCYPMTVLLKLVSCISGLISIITLKILIPVMDQKIHIPMMIEAKLFEYFSGAMNDSNVSHVSSQFPQCCWLSTVVFLVLQTEIWSAASSHNSHKTVRLILALGFEVEHTILSNYCIPKVNGIWYIFAKNHLLFWQEKAIF